ncbi:helix-turn-helix domain-containing protein [Oscillatoria sp. FACHB-1406]|uniref:helix-turn-helix domain-containing protein n=1 Tax=Oscillatoria sp. FACHB-1406 TaxID=2692846 RepID=UPI0016876C7A|nr:helix-turn-helix domain-containing protein [Oscillatoria sp. FACHB-1406]MBD2576714.1 helix-turn-helix domain-containing protein [Oscillatoria sp. FACHB-1406]
MLLKSLTYPKATGNPMREKVCRDVAEMLEQLSNRIKESSGSSLPPNANPPRPRVRTTTDPEEERRERCRQIGQILCQAREKRSLSQQWLFSQTRVPIHQIQALEAGRIDELPEDVYLRSFIRQLGNALGLNGSELAASLPVRATSVVPTWYHHSSGFNFEFSSAHFYFGYATLLLSAVGGLSLLSEWVVPEVSTVPNEGNSYQQLNEKERAQTEAPVRARANMAPPERLDG